MSKLTFIKPFTFALFVAGALATGPVLATDGNEEGKQPEQEQEKNDAQQRALPSADGLLLSQTEGQQGESGAEGEEKDKEQAS